jgi:hypothetical protein
VAKSHQNENPFLSNSIYTTQISYFHKQTQPLYKDPESKAEKAVNLIKEKIIPTAKTEEVKQAAAAAGDLDQKTKQVETELKTERKSGVVESVENPLISKHEEKPTSDTTVAKSGEKVITQIKTAYF